MDYNKDMQGTGRPNLFDTVDTLHGPVAQSAERD